MVEINATNERLIREHYKQLYTHEFDNISEMEQFLEKHKLPQFTQCEINHFHNPVTIKEI